MNKVFILGSINMDLVFDTVRMPELGETVKSRKFFMAPGGKGANQAVACASQGAQAFMIGSVGDDSLSSACISSLQSRGVNCDHVIRIKDMTCGVAGILLEQSDNRIITSSGANSVQDTARILNILNGEAQPNDYLISQLEIPLFVIQESFVNAKRLGLRTILNAAPAQPLDRDLLEHTDILVVNEIELQQVTGIMPDSEKNIDHAVNILLDSGVQSVVLTLGENGSMYFDNETHMHISAYHVDVVDTTAAGDTYIGVFISRLIAGDNIRQAMQYATAGSALAIQKLGAQQSIPTWKEIEHFMKESE